MDPVTCTVGYDGSGFFWQAASWSRDSCNGVDMGCCTAGVLSNVYCHIFDVLSCCIYVIVSFAIQSELALVIDVH